jgi:hypothetical protein
MSHSTDEAPGFYPFESVGSDWLEDSSDPGLAHLRVLVDESPGDIDVTHGTVHPQVNQLSRHASVSSSAAGKMEDLKSLSMNVEKTTKRTWLLAFLVVLMGTAAASAFMALGITAAQKNASDSFQKRAIKVAVEIEKSWQNYDTAALWIHQACHDWRTNEHAREDFALLYRYIRTIPLDFYAMNWLPNITHDERTQLEAEGKTGWQLDEEQIQELRDRGVNHTNSSYTGFMGLEADPNNPGELVYIRRSEQSFYFPIHVSAVQSVVCRRIWSRFPGLVNPLLLTLSA